MISFEVLEVRPGFTFSKIAIRIANQIEVGEINRKINFYYELNGSIKILDTSNFYSISLPNDVTFQDKIIANNDIINFRLSDPCFFSGAYIKIIAISVYSNQSLFISKPLFVKNKPIGLPQISIVVKYDTVFKTIVNINLDDLTETEAMLHYYIVQEVLTYGVGNTSLAKSGDTTFQNGTTTFEFPTIKKLGSYKVLTTVYNSRGEKVFELMNNYFEAADPLNLFYKQEVDTLNQNNAYKRATIKAFYKIEYGNVKQIVKIKVAN